MAELFLSSFLKDKNIAIMLDSDPDDDYLTGSMLFAMNRKEKPGIKICRGISQSTIKEPLKLQTSGLCLQLKR